MANAKTFEMTTGPYIPLGHARYGLLPRKAAEGGEVFSFPEELYSVEDLIREKETSYMKSRDDPRFLEAE